MSRTSNMVNILQCMVSEDENSDKLYSILDNHYEKYVIFYNIVKQLDISMFDSILCDVSKKGLDISIDCNDILYIPVVGDELQHMYDTDFDILISVTEDNILNISIKE